MQSALVALTHLTPHELSEDRRIILWRPDPGSEHGLIIAEAPGLSMWPLTGLRVHQQLVGVTLLRLATTYAIAVTPGRYLSAVLSDNESGMGLIEFGRTTPQDWERFLLEPVTSYGLRAELRPAFETLAAFMSGPLHASRLPTPASSTLPKPEDWTLVFQAITGFLPQPQWAEIGLKLLQDVSSWPGHIKDALQDPWLTTALPALKEWLGPGQRRSMAPQTIGRDVDIMSQAGLGGIPASLGQVAASTVRRLIAPRKICCIVATARNEGLYILEWIAHHRALGIEHFFIYTNDNDDGSDRLLAALAASGEITWIKSEIGAGVPAQNKAYGHALSMLPDTLDFEWTVLIDLDEFICLDSARFDSIHAYLRWQSGKPTDAIALNWLMFGSNGQAAWRDEPVSMRFPHPFHSLSGTIKSIVRTNKFFTSHPHFPVTDICSPVRYRDADGNDHFYDPNAEATAATQKPTRESAWVAHYAFKSVDEFLWKSTRNRGDVAVKQEREFFVRSDIASLFVNEFQASGRIDAACVTPAATRLTAHLARLHALPGISGAYAEVVQTYRSRISEIRVGFREALSQSHEPVKRTLANLIETVGAA